MTPNVMLAGCSFTDPAWQSVRPWSLRYGSTVPSYVVAKAGMGIKGICTEALYRLRELDRVNKLILVLPTLWRMDIEINHEGHLCNCMVDLVVADHASWAVQTRAERKWITSGGLHYDRGQESGKIFDLMYRAQGFYVLLKEHLRALHMLQMYCDTHNIEYHISAISDPMTQLQGLDDVRCAIEKEFDCVGYEHWFRFDGKFIDEFLGHHRHPDDAEHEILNKIIQEVTA